MNAHMRKKRDEARALFETKETWTDGEIIEGALSLSTAARRFFFRMFPQSTQDQFERFHRSPKARWRRRRKAKAAERVSFIEAQNYTLDEKTDLLWDLPSHERRAFFNTQDAETTKALEPTMREINEFFAERDEQIKAGFRVGHEPWKKD